MFVKRKFYVGLLIQNLIVRLKYNMKAWASVSGWSVDPAKASKRVYGHADFARGFPAAGDGLFDGLEHVGGIVTGSTLGADAGGNVLDDDILPFDSAGQVSLSFSNDSVAVFAVFPVPKSQCSFSFPHWISRSS